MFLPNVARNTFKKCLGQEGDVVAPLAQRRQVELDDVEPVKKVLAEIRWRRWP